MRKADKYTFGGALRDITKSKHPGEFYYEAQHIRILATDNQSTYSVTNERGTTQVLSIPDVTLDTSTNTITYGSKSLVYNSSEVTDLGSQTVLGTAQNHLGQIVTREGAILFLTNNSGFDTVWQWDILDGTYDFTLLYVRDMGFSTSRPIQGVYNYENENIEKVYWVDGASQIRFLNTRHDTIDGNIPLIDVPVTSINSVGTVNFSQPVITSVSSGGNHTAGMIQYGYNLYRLNGSQTKLSPISDLVPLDKGDNLGGGDVNEVVGSIPIVEIDNLDQSYDYIKVYSIKYTTLNATPEINLIDEREITGTSITIVDDGSITNTVTLDELLFLGSDPIVPQHIEAKDNRLFPTNIDTIPFSLPDEMDMRAYSFNSGGTSLVFDNLVEQNGTITGDFIPVNSTFNNIPLDHAAINLNYDTYKFHRTTQTLGGEGPYLFYTLNQDPLVDSPEDKRFFKDNEVYRLGIQFYNRLGQTSLPKWIADFRAPDGNMQGNYNTLSLTFKGAFTTFISTYPWATEDDRPVGFKLLLAERKSTDRTIVAQGILTSMMFQVTGSEGTDNQDQFASFEVRKQFADSEVKVPSFLTREFERIPSTLTANNNNTDGTLAETWHAAWATEGGDVSNNRGGEIFSVDNNNGLQVGHSFQHTKMMQLYSPELIMLNETTLSSGMRLKVRGLCKATANGTYSSEVFTDTQLEKHGGRLFVNDETDLATYGGLNPRIVSGSEFYIQDNEMINTFDVPENTSINNAHGFLGPSGDNTTMNFKQWYRQFGEFINDDGSGGIESYAILGVPELSPRGDDLRYYNNLTKYGYRNTLEGFLVDGDELECENDNCPVITSINSHNADCITVVTTTEAGLENIHASAGTAVAAEESGVLLADIRRSDLFIYGGNIYGGNSFEEKKNTNYIEIGTYTPFPVSGAASVTIDSPGDTYVGTFRFLRIGKTDTEVFSTNQSQLSEIVEYRTETTIDLKNRSDVSLNEWDSRFQPRYTEYHSYNTVYSQKSDLITNQDTIFNFRRVDKFDTRTQASQLKIPNEAIDSWTDLLSSETYDINGKYGPVVNIVEHNDELYTFQREAVGIYNINPVIQVAGTEGEAVQLGRGNILNNHQYITTRSGCINKWGIVSAKTGLYYYDALNKGVYRIGRNGVEPLSDLKGQHTFFAQNYNYNDLVVDNPYLSQGAKLGYDNYNGDIYITLYQGDQSFTYVFNERLDQFIDFKTYTPDVYLYKGDQFLAATANDIHLLNSPTGTYNNYFGQIQPSYITLMVNPQSDYDCVFDNIHYNSEIYLNDIDQPNETLTHIQAYNEYQDSGLIPLVYSRDGNLRRKFREWRAAIPRTGRNRIRNPWIFLKLELQNNSNYEMILHDIIIHYTSRV